MTESPPPASPPDSSTGRLVARERVRAMEALAGTIAHEIRAAVLGLTSAAQLLRYALPQDPVAEKSLGRILQESERLSALHESLSEYATEVPPRFATIDPDAVWHQVLTSMRGALEANSVVVSHAPSPSRARCLIDEEQMTRAFERIVHHATRVQPGSSLSVTSSVSAGLWQSTMSTTDQATRQERSGSPDFDRPTFLMALANRTLVAHGGDIADHSVEHSSLRISLRLPLSPNE